MEILRNKVVIVAAASAAEQDRVSEEFRSKGSEVIVTSGGIEAYDMIRERRIDAVVTSAQLSSGTPIQLLSYIRHLNYDIPVILFGSTGDELSQTESLHKGFSAFFFQSLTPPNLSLAVARGLEFVEKRRRRRAERITVAAEVDLRLSTSVYSSRVPVLNLSRGGMFLSLERDFPSLETVFDFNLKFLPAIPQPDLTGKALVRWVRERSAGGQLPGVGVEFAELPAETRSFIDAYLARQSPKR